MQLKKKLSNNNTAEKQLHDCINKKRRSATNMYRAVTVPERQGKPTEDKTRDAVTKLHDATCPVVLSASQLTEKHRLKVQQ
jgi:hypothetical protein